MSDPNELLFDHAWDLPDSRARRRYEALVGLDDVKETLAKRAAVLLDPARLDSWSERHHGAQLPAVAALRERAPLVLLAGDVGTGKTTLAETFGDDVARREGIQVRVMRLSLRTRGRGNVGDMTVLLGMAFDLVRQKARIHPATVFVIDEADALAASREHAHMHHEDRAGVNALIRGIDSIVAEHLRVLTVMCTNRLGALDPAVRRRAAAVFEFARPDDSQRRAVLRNALVGSGITEEQIAELARLTGQRDGLGYGCTYSDLADRLIPGCVLAAYPDRALSFELLAEQAAALVPTRPFGSA